VARDNLFSQQNSYKAYTGFLRGLRDPKLIDLKRQKEEELRAAVERDPKMREEFGGVWQEVAAAYESLRGYYEPFWLLERGAAQGSDLLGIARGLLRLAGERTKPNAERLREYRDTALPSVEASLYAETPISDSMETTVIGNYLDFLRHELGADDPIVKSLLNGKSPEEVAKDYVNSSKLSSVSERKRLAADVKAVRSSQDGMIRLARVLDAPARELRKRYEDEVEAVLRTSAAKIARARFKVYGANEYPDGTFTLRLSYGPVKGYANDAGQMVPYATTFEGLYQRASYKEPFRLPERWLKAKSTLDLSTPLNFVTTADTHGGNSGSPTVNTKGEVVGILFDGNIESLPNRFIYTEDEARSVHVASQGIVEALRKVYRVPRLIKELDLQEK
jgi:hypothetical protein